MLNKKENDIFFRITIFFILLLLICFLNEIFHSKKKIDNECKQCLINDFSNFNESEQYCLYLKKAINCDFENEKINCLQIISKFNLANCEKNNCNFCYLLYQKEYALDIIFSLDLFPCFMIVVTTIIMIIINFFF